MEKTKKVRASTIGTPLFHRKRRNWQDDSNLLLEFLGILKNIDSPYDYFDKNVKSFREKIEGFRQSGFEENFEVFLLAMWLREQLSELTIKQGSYNLKVHEIKLPYSVDEILNAEEKKITRGYSTPNIKISLSELFPNPRLRAYALERIQMLHRGDIVAYLSSLVSKEKSSLMSSTLMSCSASILDMINICEHKLDTRKLKVIKKFSVGETDLWVPQLSLGVEVCDTWNEKKETEVIRVLCDTNFRRRALHLSLVTADDMSDVEFVKLKEIEKRNILDNLSVMRIGDFGPFLDELSKYHTTASG